MEKFIVSDGAEIAYVDEGTPRLGTIVFVHGGPGFHSAYLGGFASSIKDDFRILLYDQRGSGLSGRTVKESSITINRYVEDLYEFLRDRKAVDVILLGHSFGGLLFSSTSLLIQTVCKGLSLRTAWLMHVSPWTTELKEHLTCAKE